MDGIGALTNTTYQITDGMCAKQRIINVEELFTYIT